MDGGKHTPTPWKTHACYVFSVGENPANICAMSQPRASKLIGYSELDIGSDGFHEACENAAFIVRAANAHDALVAALQQSEVALSTAATHNRYDDREQYLAVTQIERVRDLALAALKLAEGQS